MSKHQIGALDDNGYERNSQAGPSDGISVVDMLEVVWRRRYLFLMVFVAFAALGFFFVYFVPGKAQLHMRVVFPYYVNSVGLHTSLFTAAEGKSVINHQFLKLNQEARLQKLKVTFADVQFLQGFVLDTANTRTQSSEDGKINFSWQIDQRYIGQAEQMLEKLKLRLQAVFETKVDSFQIELSKQLTSLRRRVKVRQDMLLAINKQQVEQSSHHDQDGFRFLMTMKAMDELVAAQEKVLSLEQLLAGLHKGGFSSIERISVSEHKAAKLLVVNLLALFASLILVTLVELARPIIIAANKAYFKKCSVV